MHHLEQTYSYCSVPEPRSRKIVSNNAIFDNNNLLSPVALGALYQLLRDSGIRDDFLLHSILVSREKSYTGRAKLSELEATKQDGLNEETCYSSRSAVQLIFLVLGMDFEILNMTEQLKILQSNFKSNHQTPFHVFHIFRATGISVNSRTCATLRDVLSTMAYVNACLNPILYSVRIACIFPTINLSVYWSPFPRPSKICATRKTAPAQEKDEHEHFRGQHATYSLFIKSSIFCLQL